MVTNIVYLELSCNLQNYAKQRIKALYKIILKFGSGNDLVTEITVNFAFYCFYPHYVKNNCIYNPLITLYLPPFALPLLNI